MALTAGARFGPYEVVALLGAGGMGEVYRARDTRLHRDVAIKVLPELFAGDPALLLRFEREATVLASLNHPNIAHVHGLEESGSVRALVMELVEGPTLADRTARGPLPVREACTIARQIAEAVEAAHEAGIVHRDLKPANIKVRSDGRVKVLDFGLAKAVDGGGPAISGPATTRLHAAAHTTQAGTVVGTVTYMAPEQARGQVVDKRADIWAFGCLVYEMLTGRRLFDGATVSDTLAAVLTGEIDLRGLPAAVPPRIRELLARCLDRDVKTRLRDIGEARVALGDVAAGDGAGAAAAGRRGGLRGLAWGLIVVAGAVGAAAAVQRYLDARAATHGAPVYRFQIATPPMFDLTDFDVSPDGRTLAFVALADEKIPAVWIRPLDAAEATVLPGTEGARGVFWAPDSRAVGYTASRQLHRRSLQGGSSRAISGYTGQFIGAAWSGDTIVFASYPGGLMRVSAEGGEPTVLTRPRNGDRLHGRPVFLPGGRRVLFTAFTATGPQICAVSIDDPRMACTETTAALVASIGTDRVLALQGGSLLVDRFDAGTMRPAGEPVPAIREDVPLRAAGHRPAVAYSSAGVLAFRSGAAAQRRLVWVDRTGRRSEVVATGRHDSFDLSPDGARILAAGTDDGGNDIVSLIDVSRGVVSRAVAGERGWANDPVWSPDGREFAYTQRTDRWRIAARPVDGGDERTLYESLDADIWVEDWSRDGRFVAVGSSRGWRNPSVLLVPVSGGVPQTVPAEGEIVDEYHFSPDGRWLAYNSDATGRQEVYVTPLPPTGERWQVSSAGGVQPRWRRDGRELYYIQPDGTMMVVAIAEGQAFRPSAPRRLFTLPEGLGSPIFDEYAVTADGQRFLVAEPIRSQAVQPINVIVNWRPGR